MTAVKNKLPRHNLVFFDNQRLSDSRSIWSLKSEEKQVK